MGYRSQVLFWVEKPAVGRLLTALNTNKEAFDLCFRWAEHEKTTEGHLRFYWDDIKWYSGYSETVQVIEEFMSELEKDHLDELYGFHRLGEEFGDHESQGSSEIYCAYPSQHLVFEKE